MFNNSTDINKTNNHRYLYVDVYTEYNLSKQTPVESKVLFIIHRWHLQRFQKLELNLSLEYTWFQYNQEFGREKKEKCKIFFYKVHTWPSFGCILANLPWIAWLASLRNLDLKQNLKESSKSCCLTFKNKLTIKSPVT